MEFITAISLICSTVVGFIAGALGGFDSLLQCLIFVMCIDIVTGIWVSVHYHRSCKTQTGKFSSRALRHGMCNKILILFVVSLSVVIDYIAGMDFLRDITVTFYIIEESMSVLENVALMGVPLPKKVMQVLDVLDEERYVRKEDEPPSLKKESQEIFKIGNKDKQKRIRNKKKDDDKKKP